VTVGRYLQQAIQTSLLLLVIRMVDLVQTLAYQIFVEGLQDTMTTWEPEQREGILEGRMDLIKRKLQRETV
jgi:hypothetical protein